MIDSHRTSASTSHPTLVDDGTPAGHPTPAGEPTSADMSPADQAAVQEQPDLFPGAPSPLAADPIARRVTLEAMGRFILSWGRLELTTAEKLTAMRHSFGDVRVVGGRVRPTIQKLLAELRALVAMRDRHDKQVLTVIAEIDGTLQRTAQFRMLVLEGAQGVDGDMLLCRDIKNGLHEVSPEDLARETAQLDRIRCQIAML